MGPHTRAVDAAILLVGDELLSGHTRDANGQYLAARLSALGHRVVAVRVTPDEDEPIARDLLDLLRFAQLVVVTGGLGPTHDDRTTEAVGKALGLGLVTDEAALAALARRFESRSQGALPRHVLDAGRKMVTTPQGATTLRNPVGTAVGYAIARPPTTIVVLPGVPSEMQAMFEQEVVGKVVPKSTAPHVEEVVLRMPEAEFGARLGQLARASPGVAIGSYPKSGSPDVVIRLRGVRDDVLRARAAIEAAFKQHVVIRHEGES